MEQRILLLTLLMTGIGDFTCSLVKALDNSSIDEPEALPADNLAVTAENTILPILTSKVNSTPPLMAEERRALPSIPFFSSNNKDNQPNAPLGPGFPSIPGLSSSSSGPTMYLGTFQLLSMPMPNIRDFAEMLGNLPQLPTFNLSSLPFLGNNSG